MADSLERRLVGKATPDSNAASTTATPASEDGPKKKAKPDDLVRVYETIIQVDNGWEYL